MTATVRTTGTREELEARVLLAALKQSFEKGDKSGTDLAYRELGRLLKSGQQAEPVAFARPDPVAVGGPDPSAAAEPEPVRAAQPEPIAVEPPEPVGVAPAEPIGAAQPQPIAVEPPEPVGVAPAEPIGAAEPEPLAMAEPVAAVDTYKSEAPTDGASVAAQELDSALTAESSAHPVSEATIEPPAAQPAKQALPPPAGSAAALEEALARIAAASPDSQSDLFIPAPIQPAASPAAASPEAGAPTVLTQPEADAMYELLEKDGACSFEQIHIQFLRLIRKLLATRTLTLKELRHRLRALCVAHDVLRDPVTRTDYDFRRIGLRNQNQPQTPEEPKSSESIGRVHLKIGELLRCAEILENSELEIAVDMHKAMPEMRFGEFLVKQGFLARPELEAALLGQYMISKGKISVGQFQVAMYNFRTNNIGIGDTLLSAGWIEPVDLEAYQQPALPNTTTLLRQVSAAPLNVAPATVEEEFEISINLSEPSLNMTPSPAAPAEPRSAITASSALPSWAGNLWDEESAPAVPDITGLVSQQPAAQPHMPPSDKLTPEPPLEAGKAAKENGEQPPVPAKPERPLSGKAARKAKARAKRLVNLEPVTGDLESEPKDS